MPWTSSYGEDSESVSTGALGALVSIWTVTVLPASTLPTLSVALKVIVEVAEIEIVPP